MPTLEELHEAYMKTRDDFDNLFKTEESNDRLGKYN